MDYRATPMDYPATFDLHADSKIANWRPLVHWLLAIPHWIVAGALGSVGNAVAFISWFIIVFTGKLPEGLASIQCLVMRYQTRAFSYVIWLREPYPPFEFETTPDDPGSDPPIKVAFRPELEERNRLTVGLRFLWAIPLVLFGLVIGIAVFFVVIGSFFAVIITGSYPEGMRDFVVKAQRYFIRMQAYLYLLTDRYPPLALD